MFYCLKILIDKNFTQKEILEYYFREVQKEMREIYYSYSHNENIKKSGIVPAYSYRFLISRAIKWHKKQKKDILYPTWDAHDFQLQKHHLIVYFGDNFIVKQLEIPLYIREDQKVKLKEAQLCKMMIRLKGKYLYAYITIYVN